MKVMKKQTNSKMCLICGIENEAGLKASFYEMEDKTVVSIFDYKEHHQSYPGRAHGGMITCMLDELIGRAIWIDEPQTWGTSKFDKEHRRMAIAEYTVLKQMFLSSEAIAFYEQNIKYFNDERYRSIANFLVEQNANGQSTDINDIISLIQLAELPNSEALVNIVSGLALSKESEYSITVLRDCYRVILEERSKIHDRYTLKKALEGKSPQEQARIVNDLVSRKKI